MSQRDPVVRFWSHVERREPDACWPWTAAKNWRGNGLFGLTSNGPKRMVSATRYAWELERGPIPPGMHVLHHCDDPSCCNTSHMFLGTHLDNMRDKAAKGRARRGFEHRPRLTLAEVRMAAQLHEAGVTWAQLGRDFNLPYQTVRRRVLKEYDFA